ncbi:conserved hypothetical protein [Oleispira antarctica RB-8]|uniref:Uncharacterized protein n=1 Tax=Oleispira antarctica RB-8 TaxID=698738 RepID=R4YNH7_OLEAN|nr:conserved hypothetical protein [Oleispira antarctica RB-8]
MIKKILIIFGITCSSLILSSTANAEVTLKNNVFEVVIATAEDGSQTEQWRAPDKILPGEKVGYQINFKNNGDEPAADIIIVNPIPEHTIYVQNSAKGLNTTIEFSVNNGKTFALPSQLFMEKDGQRVQAEAADYTQVRWILDKPLTAGASSTVQYIVKIK